ncbi:MAG: ribonuclease Y, partial [Candidatus Riflebacteria bacterium]|nr:ribonuclease Y [Candidatus Riflebacteria bacterium]
MLYFFVALLGVGVGYLARFLLDRLMLEAQLRAAESSARSITENAQLKAENLLSELRLKFKEDEERRRLTLESEAQWRRKELDALEERLVQKEGRLDQRGEDLDKWEARISEQLRAVEARDKELASLVSQHRTELEKIGGLTQAAAREQLLAAVQAELEYDVAVRVKEAEARVREESKRRAAKILAQAVQRCSVDFAAEALITVVPLPSDEMKGRIIGREGRNIRAFETLTGIDVIVDDTPEAVVLSGFNSIKREIARMTMEKMVTDGRIHPAKIEQVYEQCQRELYQTIRETGEDAILKLGLAGMHEKLVAEVGKLRYRTSFGQNLLEHSLEVAMLAATIAAEVGANVALTKRAALLHDIGKVCEGEGEGSHAILGGEIARKLGEKEEVVNAIAAHHEEVEQKTVEAIIVQVADTLSAARPGARRSTLESYIKRLENLESIAREFKGVSHAYAIQAGREIRVLVKPSTVDDAMCAKLATELAKKI